MKAQFPEERTVIEKITRYRWSILAITTLIVLIGVAMLHSYDLGQGRVSYAKTHIMRFLLFLPVVFVIPLVPLRLWMTYAYEIYFFCLLLIIVTAVLGVEVNNAKRWIDLKFMYLQPSEFMKVAIALVLARYFHNLSHEETQQFRSLFTPMILIAVPAFLVFRQPDLGTALLIAAVGGTILFAAGVRLRFFIASLAALIAAVPLAWPFLYAHQKKRILVFLGQEAGEASANWHIDQASVAIGYGGWIGRGYTQGAYSHAGFVSERHTDFIYAMFAEEFGFLGGIVLLLLFGTLLFKGFSVSLRSRSHFGRYLAFGLTCNIFFYVFVNLAMNLRLAPVVGVPLPLISYGGTAMLSVMGSIALLLCIAVNDSLYLPREKDLR